MTQGKTSIWAKRRITGRPGKKLSAIRAARIKAARDAPEPDLRIRLADSGKPVTSKFGAVMVSNAAPDARTVRGNVKAGREALKRATEALVRPGVTLKLGADVPRFRADADRPGMLIRELNGKVQRGRIVKGAFVAAD
jgi:hypothetical protein